MSWIDHTTGRLEDNYKVEVPRRPNSTSERKFITLDDSVHHFVRMMEMNNLVLKTPVHFIDTVWYAIQCRIKTKHYLFLRCPRSIGKGLSWLSSMDRFLHLLQLNRTFSLRHIRIIRFEDFLDRGSNICRNLLNFIGRNSLTGRWNFPELNSQKVNKVSLPFFFSNQ